jgi:hypothetical protein
MQFRHKQIKKHNPTGELALESRHITAIDVAERFTSSKMVRMVAPTASVFRHKIKLRRLGHSRFLETMLLFR